MRCFVMCLVIFPLLAQEHHPPAGVPAMQALRRMLDGNERFVRLKAKHPDESLARRKELVESQHPFAIVIGCADSRVPPEILFDQGLGDLFVIRNAGNVVDDDVLGSIEYAAEHLGTKLVVVLGHEKCGAVSFAVKGGAAEGHLKSVVNAIAPVVEEAKKMPGDPIHNCVIRHAQRAAQLLRSSEPILKPMVEKGELRIVSADYDLRTGRVRLLD